MALFVRRFTGTGATGFDLAFGADPPPNRLRLRCKDRLETEMRFDNFGFLGGGLLMIVLLLWFMLLLLLPFLMSLLLLLLESMISLEMDEGNGSTIFEASRSLDRLFVLVLLLL
jgi:hypothetical protein